MEGTALELYNYTLEHCKEEISIISKECVAPLIACRRVVNQAIVKFGLEHNVFAYHIFSIDDFLNVSLRIYDEIMKGVKL